MLVQLARQIRAAEFVASARAEFCEKFAASQIDIPAAALPATVAKLTQAAIAISVAIASMIAITSQAKDNALPANKSSG